MAAAASAIAVGLGLAVPAAGYWLSASPSSAATFARALALLAAAFTLLIPIGAILLALRAPRGSVPPIWRALSLGALGVLVACTLAVAAAGIVWSDAPRSAKARPPQLQPPSRTSVGTARDPSRGSDVEADPANK